MKLSYLPSFNDSNYYLLNLLKSCSAPCQREHERESGSVQDFGLHDITLSSFGRGFNLKWFYLIYCEWYSTHVEMCSRPSDMNVMCFIIFQRHRNQRVQQPLWWRAALTIHTLLFRREADGRRDDRRWKRHPCPGLTTGSTGSYLTRVLREKTKKKRGCLRRTGTVFKPRYFPYEDAMLFLRLEQEYFHKKRVEVFCTVCCSCLFLIALPYTYVSSDLRQSWEEP